ncbi:hypothetical protein B0H11DRAFT_1311872 [Mycena galericulata]|nr:hypothetical protein B0H11DRAFT_1311872 [Mycena galericulata]
MWYPPSHGPALESTRWVPTFLIFLRCIASLFPRAWNSTRCLPPLLIFLFRTDFLLLLALRSLSRTYFPRIGLEFGT